MHLENRTFLEVASMVVTWWIVVFCAVLRGYLTQSLHHSINVGVFVEYYSYWNVEVVVARQGRLLINGSNALFQDNTHNYPALQSPC